MASPVRRRTIREATPDDAVAIREIYGGGDVEEFALRVTDHATAPGTTHYVAESESRVVAAFALTALGRLRPGGKPRLILHEIKLRPNDRGTGIAEDIFGWLATCLGVGTERELLALAPPGQRPSSFDEFGLSESHQVFRWPVREGSELL
ncbi:GNAT family N-acetyltransferase [Streptomyces sp. NPDC057413]|uniref:GNAT family N-acetyltransferase n=1 Tax=Streptomyces sp. NPDC057413 TaxID=3346124 RepID=UPI0036C7D0E1